MKKFLFGFLTAVMMFGFGNFAQASDLDNMCCRGGYYCASDNDGDYCYNNGDYCGRYGCGNGYGNGYRR